MDSAINHEYIERTRVTADEKFFFQDAGDKFEEVKERWVTDQLHHLDPLPAAVLDIGKVRVNCQRMIDATRRLGLLWRPHVKTHKVGPLCLLGRHRHGPLTSASDHTTHPASSRRRGCYACEYRSIYFGGG
jgi:hypothetical protein